MDRPLPPIPDDHLACQEYCGDLMREIWRLDRRWAQLKADAFDADRCGHAMDVLSFMRAAEREVD